MMNRIEANMTDFNMRLADLTVSLSVSEQRTAQSCEKYIVHDNSASFHVQASEEDLNKEADFFTKRNGETAKPLSRWQLEKSALYRKIAEEMIDYNRILIHGSALSVDQNGYLFIAPSGTGKSTHGALWRKVFKDRVVMINDDKPLVSVNQNDIRVYGTPWDGKHHLSTNTSACLKAICRIYRSETNHIEAMDKADALACLLEQTYRSTDPKRVVKTLEMLNEIVKRVQVYALYCNMEEEAALTAYETLRKEQKR